MHRDLVGRGLASGHCIQRRDLLVHRQIGQRFQLDFGCSRIVIDVAVIHLGRIGVHGVRVLACHIHTRDDFDHHRSRLARSQRNAFASEVAVAIVFIAADLASDRDTSDRFVAQIAALRIGAGRMVTLNGRAIGLDHQVLEPVGQGDIGCSLRAGGAVGNAQLVGDRVAALDRARQRRYHRFANHQVRRAVGDRHIARSINWRALAVAGGNACGGVVLDHHVFITSSHIVHLGIEHQGHGLVRGQAAAVAALHLHACSGGQRGADPASINARLRDTDQHQRRYRLFRDRHGLALQHVHGAVVADRQVVLESCTLLHRARRAAFVKCQLCLVAEGHRRFGLVVRQVGLVAARQFHLGIVDHSALCHCVGRGHDVCGDLDRRHRCAQAAVELAIPNAADLVAGHIVAASPTCIRAGSRDKAHACGQLVYHRDIGGRDAAAFALGRQGVDHLGLGTFVRIDLLLVDRFAERHVGKIRAVRSHVGRIRVVALLAVRQRLVVLAKAFY